jgi:diguanylate cyclase (GGDEF)-like protein
MSDRFDDDKIGQTITCSIGVAVIKEGRTDYDVIFQWADSALYRVKDENKGAYRMLEVPADKSLPEKRYLPQNINGDRFEAAAEKTLVRTEEELVLFCMELLENVPDITAALKMISERTCRFYGLDDMVCVEHEGESTHVLYQWSEVDKAQYTQRMSQAGVYTWSRLSHLAEPDGSIICSRKMTHPVEMEEAQSALLVLSTSVRAYSGSIVFADRSRDRDWERMKHTLVRISNQIFYRLRMLRKEDEKQRDMDKKLNHDALTGLPVYNRFISMAGDWLDKDSDRMTCCIYTDFSNFQYYNEIYGYEMGDGMLKLFADAVRSRYGEKGIFCRMSSDNFVGFIRDMEFEEVLEDYRNFTFSFAEECNIQWPLTNLVLASGIYEVRNTDISVTAMVDNANEARKKCKEQKVETVVKVYTESLRQELENAKAVNSNILKGLKNNEFYAYLQPKVSLKTGKIEGAEALVRWIKPDGSRVMPDEFIGIAEKNGYITKIDFAVLEQVLSYLEEAVNAGEEVVPISVNFSRRNNEFKEFVPSILKRLDQYHVSADLLEAEVTESVFMADLSAVDDNMTRLREHGVEVSVDDFGSGYSSLNILSKISADTIKLDKLFLNNAGKDERGLTVIQYLTKMLKRLGFTVLAEGVETKEQLEWLKMADCDLVQGFYYAKPMSIVEFRKFLQEFNSGVGKSKAEAV